MVALYCPYCKRFLGKIKGEALHTKCPDCQRWLDFIAMEVEAPREVRPKKADNKGQ